MESRPSGRRVLGRLPVLGRNQPVRRPRGRRARGALAISIAFAGAGVVAVLLLLWLQTIILTDGRRASCVAMEWLVLIGIGPQISLVKKNTADAGQKSRWRP